EASSSLGMGRLVASVSDGMGPFGERYSEREARRERVGERGSQREDRRQMLEEEMLEETDARVGHSSRNG
ncbi:MAG TPA: hypothetical protein VIG29_08185, partial [Vicinamibacteria bacterium]